MGKRKRTLNPADAHRKKMRQREKKRMKEKRIAQRDSRFKSMAPERIENELRKVQRLEQQKEGGISKEHARVRKKKLREALSAAKVRVVEEKKKALEQKNLEPVHIKGLSRIFRDIPKESEKQKEKAKESKEDYGLPPGMEISTEVKIIIAPSTDGETKEAGDSVVDPKEDDESKAVLESAQKTEAGERESEQAETQEKDNETDSKKDSEESKDSEIVDGKEKETKHVETEYLDAPPGISNKGPPRVLRPHPAVLVEQVPVVAPVRTPIPAPNAMPRPPLQPGMHPGAMHPGGMHPGGMYPGMPRPGIHPGMVQRGFHPGMQQGMHGGPFGRGRGMHPGMQPPITQGQPPWPPQPMQGNQMGIHNPGGPQQRMRQRQSRNQSIDPLDYTQSQYNQKKPPTPLDKPPMPQTSDPLTQSKDTGLDSAGVSDKFVPVNVMVRKRTKQKMTVAQARALRAQRKRAAEEAKRKEEERLRPKPKASAPKKSTAASYSDFMSEIEALGAL
mmetsp:Transcript_2871/g.4180  ORF Transcript_2871/g.4180 Transcript_2871/m.4180 type:complete len:503 (-) Transcript_2871:108-1616(-)